MKLYLKHTVILLTTMMISFTAHSQTLTNKGQRHSAEIYSLHSKVLNEERDIFISLPENYHHSIHQYPVIVVLDAEYLFNMTDAIVKLSSSRNFMPESIVIGIPNNTGKRIDMAMELFNDKGQPFFYGEEIGQSAKYLAFIKSEVIPALAKQYRVNDHRTIIGMSPTFGPVLEAFWSESDFFNGYIALAAEIGQYLKSGERVADKLAKSISNKNSKAKAIYIGTSSKDIEKRGESEAKLYEEIPSKLKATANPKVSYQFEVVANEDHYSMALLGIKNGLETIYPREKWQISYREFWQSEDPAKALITTYQELSNAYGFEIVPIETAFYSINNLTKTAEILARREKHEQLKSWLEMALNYYPNSAKLKEMHVQLSMKE